jgi:hypothetical protein
VGANDSQSSSEFALADALGECFGDPLRFVRLAFDWGEGELIGKYAEGPDEWQADTLRDLGAGVIDIAEAIRRAEDHEAVRLATASGHGIGKSALVAWIILWAMSTRPHLNGVVTANTSKQLETKTWRELAIWWKRAINRHWFQWTATKFYHVAHPETWFVAAVPWTEQNTEAFAGQHGEHVLILFDEGSGIPDVIWEVAEGAQTSGEVLWCVFGNPTRPNGRFRECFGKFRHRWKTRQIDARNCRMANRVQAEQWVEDFGEDSDFVRVRVRGIFPRAGAKQFIDDAAIEAAQQRIAADDPGAPLVLGVDVARFGEDQSVFRYRRGRDAQTIPPRKFRGVDTMELAAFVIEEINLRGPDLVCIDGNGVGGGVVDRVKALVDKDMAKRIIEVQNGASAQNGADYCNKRVECWARMKEWLAGGCIDDDPELRDDLVGPEYGYDKDNRTKLESKESMAARGLHSPDNADALALTFAIAVGRRAIKTPPKKASNYARGMAQSGAWMN